MKKLIADYKTLLDNLHDGVYFVDNDRRILYWNDGAERITGYTEEEVVGKRCCDNILLHADEIGQTLCDTDCPLAHAIESEETRKEELYLLHKKGYRVPVNIKTTPIFDVGKIIGAVEIFSENYAKVAADAQVKKLERLAAIDDLTGIANRRYIENILNSRLEEFRRYSWTFGILFIDIDYFKNVNDKYGHKVGDELLQTIAKTILLNIRPFDTIGRWGGDEFVVVLSNTSPDNLKKLTERLRMLVENSTTVHGEIEISATVSIGGTAVHEGETLTELIDRADKLMYECKQSGRNCSRFAL